LTSLSIFKCAQVFVYIIKNGKYEKVKNNNDGDDEEKERKMR